jgi:oligopeptidase A
MTQTNPLLHFSGLPKFSEIKAEHVLPALKEVLENARTQTKKLLETTPATFENFCIPLGEINEKISRMFGPVSHLNAVVNSPDLRDAYTAALPLLSEYSTEMKQNPEIFKKYAEIKNGAQYAQLNTAQKKIIEDTLRDFKLAGIDLPEDKKMIYKEIVSKLSQICSKYSDHVLDDTNEFELLMTNKEDLKGLPESFLAQAHQRAVQDGKAKQGENTWKLTLEAPSLIPVMKYSDNDALRQKLYTANITRATKGERDNTPLMHEILKLRKDLAELVGFKSYAQYSLATKMAKSEQEVFEFLEDLVVKSKSKAKKDLEEVKAFKKSITGSEADLTPWDFGYYSEKLRQKNFDYSDEELKKVCEKAKLHKPKLTEYESMLYA